MSDELQRHVGIPLTDTLLNSDTSVSISFLVCISILLLFKQRNSIFSASLQSVFTGDLFFIGKITIGDQIQQYILLLLSLFGISLLGAYTLKAEQCSWSIIGIGFAGITTYMLFKIILMQAYFRLFFGNRIQTFIYKYISLTIMVGIVCFFAFIILLYAPLIPSTIIYVLIAAILLAYAVSIFYILFRHFFCRGDLIFHFILYLCTLEILPLLFLIKWAM